MDENVLSYSTLLDTSWTKISRDDDHAYDLFHRMQKIIILGHARRRGDNTVRSERGRMRDPQKSEDLLFLDMCHLSIHENRPDMQPNTKPITAVVDA